MRYLDMFNPICEILIECKVERFTQNLLKVIFARNCRKARLIFLAQDRVVWALRLIRIGMLLVYSEKSSRGEEIRRYADKLISNYEKRFHTKLSQNDLEFCVWLYGLRLPKKGPYRYEIREFEHDPPETLDLTFLVQARQHIPSMRAYRFIAKSPTTVIRDLTVLYENWREYRLNRARYVVDDALPILRFNNGLQWVKLTTPSIQQHEAELLRHCGNKGKWRKEGDVLYSLREPVGRGYWRPVCTLVLRANGTTGECRARFNTRPNPSLFRYIGEFVKLPIVTGLGSEPHELIFDDFPRSLQSDLTNHWKMCLEPYSLRHVPILRGHRP